MAVTWHERGHLEDCSSFLRTQELVITGGEKWGAENKQDSRLLPHVLSCVCRRSPGTLYFGDKGQHCLIPLSAPNSKGDNYILSPEIPFAISSGCRALNCLGCCCTVGNSRHVWSQLGISVTASVCTAQFDFGPSIQYINQTRGSRCKVHEQGGKHQLTWVVCVCDCPLCTAGLIVPGEYSQLDHQVFQKRN